MFDARDLRQQSAVVNHRPDSGIRPHQARSAIAGGFISVVSVSVPEEVFCGWKGGDAPSLSTAGPEVSLSWFTGVIRLFQLQVYVQPGAVTGGPRDGSGRHQSGERHLEQEITGFAVDEAGRHHDRVLAQLMGFMESLQIKEHLVAGLPRRSHRMSPFPGGAKNMLWLTCKWWRSGLSMASSSGRPGFPAKKSLSPKSANCHSRL